LCSRCCTVAHSKCAARAPLGCDDQSKLHIKINQRSQYQSQRMQDAAASTTYSTSQVEGLQGPGGTGQGQGQGGQQDSGEAFKVSKAQFNALAKMLPSRQPLRTRSTPRRSRSPEPLICFEVPDDTVNASAGTQATTTTLRLESDNGQSPSSLPQVPSMDFNDLFDLASHFRHLPELPPVVTPPSLPPAPPPAPERKPSESGAVSIVTEDVNVPTELAPTPVDDAGTPLSRVALLSKPKKTPRPGVLDGIMPDFARTSA
jgi:hypothetical protein